MNKVNLIALLICIMMNCLTSSSFASGADLSNSDIKVIDLIPGIFTEHVPINASFQLVFEENEVNDGTFYKLISLKEIGENEKIINISQLLRDNHVIITPEKSLRNGQEYELFISGYSLGENDDNALRDMSIIRFKTLERIDQEIMEADSSYEFNLKGSVAKAKTNKSSPNIQSKKPREQKIKTFAGISLSNSAPMTSLETSLTRENDKEPVVHTHNEYTSNNVLTQEDNSIGQLGKETKDNSNLTLDITLQQQQSLVTKEYIYDNSNRLRIIFINSGQYQYRQDFIYDNNGNLISVTTTQVQ